MRNIMCGVCDYHCNADVTSGEMCCLEGRRGQEGVGEDAGKRENAIFFNGCISLLLKVTSTVTARKRTFVF
jgi:hypothetical protein